MSTPIIVDDVTATLIMIGLAVVCTHINV